jgi:hypothetical protein
MTRESVFDLDRFEQLLDVHGVDLERWPEPLRSSARELLASSTDAQRVWSSAERLAALLDAAPDVLPSAELSARIAALPLRRPQGWAVWWPFGNPLAPLLAWGAAAAFGLFIGSGVVPGLEPSGEDGSGSSVSAEADDLAGSDDPAGDDVQADDWSEFELALGLEPEWEDEP